MKDEQLLPDGIWLWHETYEKKEYHRFCIVKGETYYPLDVYGRISVPYRVCEHHVKYFKLVILLQPDYYKEIDKMFKDIIEEL